MDFLDLKEQAELGDPVAQFELAELYSQDGIKSSEEEAHALYVQAAHSGHQQSLEHLIEIYRDGDPFDELILKALKEIAENGSAIAMLFYAKICLKGWDEGRLDKNIAIDYLEKLSDIGDTSAELFLSELYESGENVSKSSPKSLRLLNQAAQKDFRIAHRLFRSLKNKKSKKAFHFARVMAREGYLPALLYLCFHFRTSYLAKFLPLDWVLARKKHYSLEGFLTNEQEEELAWFVFDQYRLQAEAGDPQAQVIMGKYHALGKLIPCSLVTAFKWYKKAAVSQDLEALFELGCCYLGGYGVEKCEKKACALFEKAGKKGHIESWFYLGFYHEEVGKSSERAFNAFEQAARLGDPAAMYIVGRMYETGEGVKQSSKDAYHYYLIADKLNLESDIDQLSVQQRIACFYLPSDYQFNYDDSLKHFKFAAKQFENWRSTWQAGIYLLQSGIESCEKKAHEYFLLALQRMEEEFAWQQEPHEPFTFLKDEVAKRYLSSWSTYRWGTVLEGDTEDFTPKDLPRMLYLMKAPFNQMGSIRERFFRKRYFAIKGDPETLYQLGLYYEKNPSLDFYDERMELFQRAAELGHVKALFCLGFYSSNPKDKEFYFHRAAEKGLLRANYELGRLYLLENDTSSATKCFKIAAAGNDPDALLELAKLQRDENLAHSYYIKASSFYSPEATFEIIKYAIKNNEFHRARIYLGNYATSGFKIDSIREIYRMVCDKKIKIFCDYIESLYGNEILE